jgi:hypothetical protein
MARKAAHDQRSTPTDWACDMCRLGVCVRCIDIKRIAVLNATPLCFCRRKGHLEVRMEQEQPKVGHYRYRDSQLNVIWTTSVPKDDEAAFAYFHSIMCFGQGFMPVYVERNDAAPEREDYKMLPVRFDPDNFRLVQLRT